MAINGALHNLVIQQLRSMSEKRAAAERDHDSRTLQNAIRHGVMQEMRKYGFVAGSDPAMDPAAAAAQGPPPGDPAAEGMMPGDPMAGGGGAPPPDIAMMIQQAVQQAVQQAMSQQGGGGGGGGGGGAAGGGLKPKIDLNVEFPKMMKIVARIADTLGVPIPAADMVITTADMNQVAAGQDPASAMAAPQGAAFTPPQPIEPIKAAANYGAYAFDNGRSVAIPDTLLSYPRVPTPSLADKASALIAIQRERGLS